MGVIRKYNPETGKWEVYGSTEAKDINLIDVGDNFEDKNVEGALREISTKLNETLQNKEENVEFEELKREISNVVSTINIEDIESGVYFISVKQNDNNFVEKLVVK